MMLNITTGFSIFPVIPVSVNAFSAEIGQSRVYTTPAPYYNVHIFSFIRSGSSNHLTSTMQIVSTQTKCLTNGDTASLHTSMLCVVMPYYHTFNKWFTKHLLERCAGHETV